MTPSELRTLAGALGWPLERLAGALGVHPKTLAGWLSPKGVRAASRRSALARLHAITPAPTPERPDRVLLDVDVPAR